MFDNGNNLFFPNSFKFDQELEIISLLSLYLKFHGNLFLLKDMQDLVLQYLKKTVLRPRAIGKSEYLGGQVIVHCLSKENVLLLFLAFYLGWRVD